MEMDLVTRAELFERLGFSKDDAQKAAAATYKDPVSRTQEEKQLIHEVSEAIALENAKTPEN